MLEILATGSTQAASSAYGIGSMVIWLVVLFVFMYFFMIRPQKKETQKKNAMLSELAVGDTVLQRADSTEPLSILMRTPSSLSSEATRIAVSRCRNLQFQQWRNRKKQQNKTA